MPKHIASGLKYLAAVKLKEVGKTHQEIANELSVDRSTISHYLNGSNLSWNSIEVARTITELSPRDFLTMVFAIIKEPEDNDGCIYCSLPATWLKVMPKRVLSEERMAELRSAENPFRRKSSEHGY